MMNGRACMEDPWPQGPSVKIAHLGTSFDDRIELFGHLFDDNSSNQCHCSCIPCTDDQPLWWLMLRWLKITLLNVARSYDAKPVILVIAPLLVGMTVGYIVGRRKHVGAQERTQPYSSKFFTRIRDWLSLWCLRVGVRIAVKNSRNVGDSTHCSVESFENNGQTPRRSLPSIIVDAPEVLGEKEVQVRANLNSEVGMECESGVDPSRVPRHVAVIMDGNRRYGKAKYGSVSKGHWDGSSKLVEFAKWCIAEHISVLTVYAFSTENWTRDPSEVASLMAIFAKYSDELRVEAVKRNIRIHVLSTDSTRIPAHVQAGISRMKSETEHCTGLTMNICMSYGSRGEILNATRSIAANVLNRSLSVDAIDEAEFERNLLTSHCGDPDVLIRTSGEIRISNYLLWQLAYSEMFFVEKPWPAIEKADLLHVIRTFGLGRIRRYGK